jgi:hypothetical protein
MSLARQERFSDQFLGMVDYHATVMRAWPDTLGSNRPGREGQAQCSYQGIA